MKHPIPPFESLRCIESTILILREITMKFTYMTHQLRTFYTFRQKDSTSEGGEEKREVWMVMMSVLIFLKKFVAFPTHGSRHCSLMAVNKVKHRSACSDKKDREVPGGEAPDTRTYAVNT